MKLPTSEIIKEIRIQNEITQAVLAELINVKQQSVARWETNLTVPHALNLIALYNVFGVTPNELLGVDKTNGKYKVDNLPIYRKRGKSLRILTAGRIVKIPYIRKSKKQESPQPSENKSPSEQPEKLDELVKSFLDYLEQFAFIGFHCDNCNHRSENMCKLTKQKTPSDNTCKNWRLKPSDKKAT